MNRTRRFVWVSVVALTCPGVGSADPHLIRILATDSSPKVRAQAAIGLASRPPNSEVIAALSAALADDAAIVRGSAARSLGSIGGEETFAPLCRAAKDPDRFVSKWARWAAWQVAGRTRTIVFSLGEVRVDPGRLPRGTSRKVSILADDMTKSLQDGVLQVLVGTGRFDVASGMDFSDEVEGLGPVEPRDSRRFGVRLDIRGQVAKVSGDEHQAEVEVRIEVLGLDGVVLWEGTARGVGSSSATAGEDDYVDEYTIPSEPVDARVRAAEAAGRAAGEELSRALSPAVGGGS